MFSDIEENSFWHWNRVHQLENAIREHEAQSRTGDPNDLCWENDVRLWLVLPENRGKTLLDYPFPELPTEETWKHNCEVYWNKLKRCQLELLEPERE